MRNENIKREPEYPRLPGEEGNSAPTLFRMAGAVVLAGVAAFLPLPTLVRTVGFAAAYLLAGGGVLADSWRNIRRGEIFDENFLMSIASIGAFAIGEQAEAVAVMVFYGIGEMLQDSAVAKSRRNIEELMDLRSDRASVRRDGRMEELPPEEVCPGEIIVVNPGGKVPLDGVVESGSAHLDTRALTGEPVPRRTGPGDEVLSGTIVTDAVLEIRVTRPFAQSTVSRILELVRNAAEKKSSTERFITRFARYYTPAAVGLAVLVATLPPLAGFGTFPEWLYKGLSFLIISCPCALVLSIPLGFFGGIGGAARAGVLVKGGNYLELLGRIGTIAFDKTGTLTRGVFEVVKTEPAPGVRQEELLRLAAAAESHSNHPIARSILAAWGRPPDAAEEVRELAGRGVEARCRGDRIRVGNARMMREAGFSELPEHPETTVHVSCNDRYLGCLLIADVERPAIREALQALRHSGVRRLAMLTGDNEATAKAVAARLGIDDCRAGLLPQDKISELETLMATEPPGRITAFVGDGINDAPVLARADLGIAMGGIGSDAAIEAADVVIMTDDISRIAEAIRIAVKTRWIVWENIIFALGFKGAIMAFALFGHASVWFAIFADVGVALLAVANALRALRR